MSPKAKILIVDDEPDLREVLEEYFIAQGYVSADCRQRNCRALTCR